MNTQSSQSCPQCGCRLPADAPQGLCPRCLGALNFVTETLPPEAVPVAPQQPLPPEEIAPHFPQLEILECLGRGGMGVVYKARQKSLNRLVALKLLAPERAQDAQFAARFEKEAQALAALSHPHIVTIHDFGLAGGFYYLLMEFVDGVTLRQAMCAGRFSPEQALAIVPPVCEALQYAHERGIVHRDIKPENLLLDKEGRVKIADFGIAKILGSSQPESARGDTLPHSGMQSGEPQAEAPDARSQAVGTPAYAAPEQQTDPAHVDHRADIYSLGVVLYELLTGELPPANGLPPGGFTKRVQIDVRLEEVVLRALETRPEMRYPTAAAFQTCLAEITPASDKRSATDSPQPPAARPAADSSPPPQQSTWRLPRWTGLAAAIAGALLLLGAPLVNEFVDDHGLTATARHHRARREQAQRGFAEAKEAATHKSRQIDQARMSVSTSPAFLQRLDREREAAEVRAYQAEAAVNAAAVLKEASEQRRIALLYLLAGALASAGAVMLYHQRREAREASAPNQADHRLWHRHPMATSLAGVVSAWMLALLFTYWSGPGNAPPPPPDVLIERIDVESVGVEGVHCLVQLSFTVAGGPVEVRPLLDGPGLAATGVPDLPTANGPYASMDVSAAVLPGAGSEQQPQRVFVPGTHAWTIDFVLPSEEHARAAVKALHPIAAMRLQRQAPRALLFEVLNAPGLDAGGNEVTGSLKGWVEFRAAEFAMPPASHDRGTSLPLAPWLLLGALLLVLGATFAALVWGMRVLFKSKSTGCIVAFVMVLLLLLLGFLLPVVYWLRAKAPVQPAPPAQTSSACLESYNQQAWDVSEVMTKPFFFDTSRRVDCVV